MSWGVLVLWLIFAVLFGWLSSVHWIESGRTIPPFEVEVLVPEGVEVAILGVSIDKPLQKFGSDFNTYLADQNKSNQNANRNTAYGYFLAFLTAVFSAILEWRHVYERG